MSAPEKIAGHEIHPAASVLPLMSEAELAELAEDIRRNGLRHPIVCLRPSGVVIDGRNRLLACERAGVEPIFDHLPITENDVAPFVASTNIARRHLTPSQKAMLAVELIPFFSKEAKERQKKHGGTAPGKKESAPGREVSVGEAVREFAETGTAAAQAGKAVAASERSVERAKFVAQRSPELAAKVKRGEATLKQAEKQLRHAEQVKAIEKYVPPAGKFNVIAADPPWPYEDQLEGDGARGGLPYPPMTLREICDLDVPADKDCVLWLWTTNAHLLDGSAALVLERWGFEPKALLTWKKDRMGVGRYLRNITEHCIVAVKGSPKFTLTNQTTLLEAPRREHSRKPDEFFALVEQLCPGRARLEMFSREPRTGWTTSGAEGEKFAEPTIRFDEFIRRMRKSKHRSEWTSTPKQLRITCHEADHELTVGLNKDGSVGTFAIVAIEKHAQTHQPEVMPLSEFRRWAKANGFKIEPLAGKTAFEISCVRKGCLQPGLIGTEKLTRSLDVPSELVGRLSRAHPHVHEQKKRKAK